MKSTLLLLSLALLLTWPSLAQEAAQDNEQEPLLFKSGVTAQLLTNIFQGVLPALFEQVRDLKFSNLQSGMAVIDQLNIAITQTPSALQNFKSDQGLVNLGSFKEKAEIHFCGKKKLVVAQLKDFRISGSSKLTVVFTQNTTYNANFAGNVKTFNLGVSIETAQIEYLDFEFQEESISIGFQGERELIETQELETSAKDLLTKNKQLLIDEIKPLINDMLLSQMKKLASVLIGMHKNKDNPFGFVFEEMDVVRLIMGLFPKVKISEDGKRLTHGRVLSDSPTDEVLAKNLQKPGRAPPSEDKHARGFWVEFHESIGNNILFPLYYSPEGEDGKSSSFLDLYEIVRGFNMESFLTVQFVSTVFSKIKEDYPNEPNAPVTLACSLSEAELEKVMDDVRRPQLRFKDNNILLRFSFTCSIKVLTGLVEQEANTVSDPDFDQEFEDLDDKKEKETVPAKAQQEPEWENYRSFYAEPTLKIKAKLSLEQPEIEEQSSDSTSEQAGEQKSKQEKKPTKEQISILKIREIDLGKMTLTDKDGDHMETEEGILQAMISFGKSMVVTQINQTLTQIFPKTLSRSNKQGSKNCFPLDSNNVILDIQDGWVYFGLNLQSLLEGQILQNCVSETFSELMEKIQNASGQGSTLLNLVSKFMND